MALGEAELTEKIKTIGIYRNKARNLIALSPRSWSPSMAARCRHTREALGDACPASAARPRMSCSTSPSAQPTIGIDTHVFRVANRTGLAPGKTPLEVELTLNRVVPERYKHYAIIG